MNGPTPITGPQTDRARIAPLPAWVAHEPYDAPAEPEDLFVNAGSCILLDDTQVDLSGPLRAQHCRRAERVMTLSGAARAAQFSVAFDPTSETLDVHFVRVLRGDAVIDHTRPDAFELFRRERSLERQIVDGRLTVYLMAPDVRPGDIIESAYTLMGDTPTHKGKHTMWAPFEWTHGVLETRHRILTTTRRPIAYRSLNGAPEPVIHRADGLVDYRWRAVRRPPVDLEPFAPPWAITRAGIQVSEFESWAEVAASEAPLYRDGGPLPPDLEAAAQDIEARLANPEDRAAEAVRFVQSNLRYLALAIGEGGRLAPRSLDQIWQSRFGDCKDAALVLTRLARRLGLDAAPALVNTADGETLQSWLPTADGFDHVVVRMEINGAAHWFDPTVRKQAGRFARLVRPHFGWALPLAPGRDTLESMGPATAETIIDVEEKVVFGPRPSSPAAYELKVTHCDWRADALRERIANEGLASVGRLYLRQLLAVWPGIVPTAPLVTDDDWEENRLTVTETYELPQAWRLESPNRVEFATRDYFLRSDLPDLPAGPRRTDIYLGRPRIAVRRVRVELPQAWPVEVWEREASAPGIRYRSKLSRSGKSLLLEQRLEITEPCVPAADADAYRQVTALIAAAGDLHISHPIAGDDFVAVTRKRGRFSWTPILMLLTGAAFGALATYAVTVTP